MAYRWIGFKKFPFNGMGKVGQWPVTSALQFTGRTIFLIISIITVVAEYLGCAAQPFLCKGIVHDHQTIIQRIIVFECIYIKCQRNYGEDQPLPAEIDKCPGSRILLNGNGMFWGINSGFFSFMSHTVYE